MKTTVDLPDELLRELKVRAASTDRSLKDLMAELLQRGLDVVDGAPDEVDARVSLPLVVCAHPAAAGQEATPDRAAAVLLEQETEALVR